MPTDQFGFGRHGTGMRGGHDFRSFRQVIEIFEGVHPLGVVADDVDRKRLRSLVRRRPRHPQELDEMPAPGVFL